MENWLLYGIITSLFFGITLAVYKIGINKGEGMNPFLGGLIYTGAIFLVFALVFIFQRPSIGKLNWTGIIIVFIAGVVWALGNLFLVLAMSRGADVSRIAPIINTNTLVAVLVGIIFLKEIPSGIAMIKVIFGSLLIIIGAIFVSS